MKTPDINEREVVAHAWIDNQIRPVYHMREIMRGKNKGKYEIQILGMRDNALAFKKKIITFDDFLVPKDAALV